MHHRSRLTSRSAARPVLISFAIALSLLVSLCSPFVTRRVEAQLPIATPTPQRPGQPPGPDLPNLDAMRKLQSLTPGVPLPPVPVPSPSVQQSIIPLGMMPICDDGGNCGCVDCPPPPPPPPQNDPNYSTQRTQPYNSTGEPGITLGSRNFNWSMPLVSLSGRSGMDLNISLSYNSLVWTQEDGWIKFNADQGFPGPGFRLGFPIVQPRYYNSATGFWSYLMVTPSGGRVDFREIGTSGTYETFDSTYARLTDNGGTLVVRTTDGTEMTFANSGPNYVCNQIKDRNGNFISATYNASMPTAIADSLGRVINFNYSNGFLSTITQTWGGGTSTWATFSYSNVLFNYNFGGLQVDAPANDSLLALPTQVYLADGSSYQFTYSTWGQVYEISRIAADGHQLAYTLYNLPTDATTAQSDCPRFTEQHEWAQDWNVVNGTAAEAVTQLGVDADGSQVMITPDSTKYKQLNYTSGWQNGLPMQEEWWSGGVRQKWVTYSWTQDNTNAPYQINPRMTGTTIGDLNGNVRPTGIAYSTFTLPTGTTCNWPSDTTEYAADGSTVLRRTHTDYNLDPAYLNRNIIGLASSRSVFDGSGTLFSKTDFHYDETALQNPGAIAQHDDANYGAAFVQGRGNLTSATRYNVNNLAQSVTSSVAYNAAGSAVSATDPLGHQVTTSYADSNGGNTFAYPTSVTDADGNATTSQYDYDMGLLTRTQTPAPQGFTQGPVRNYMYDYARRIVQMLTTLNGATGPYTFWIYPQSQTVVQSFTSIIAGSPEGYSVQVLDGAGRVRATASDHPTGSGGQYRGQYIIYDNMGRVAQQSNPTEMDANWNNTGDDAGGWIYTQQAYDWKGRATVTTNPDNTQRTMTYGGCGCAGGEVVTSKDEAGRQTRTTADVFGRLAKAEELNWDGSVYATANYAYDALDHLTSINHEGQIRSFAFDGYGRLQTRTTPEQGASSYAYNNDDTVQTVTDARGATATFTYNARQLVRTITYGVTSGVAATPNVAVDFDAAGNRLWMTDGLGRVDYVYDQLSQLTSEKRSFSDSLPNAPLPNNAYQLSYTYNRIGQLMSVTNPFGSQVNYARFNQSGEISSVSGSGSMSVPSYAANLSYRAFGAAKQIGYGNGRQLSLAYDNRLRLTQWNMPGVMDWNFAYNYFNENNSRVTYANNVNDGTLDRSYQYDHVGRLVSAHSGQEARAHIGIATWAIDGPYSQDRGYDQFGNATHRVGWGGYQGGGFDQSYTFANNRLVQDPTTGATIQYDAAGNLTNDGSQSFSYDATGQQTYASGNATAQSYDGYGLRGKKVDSTTTTYYLRSSVLGGQVVAEVDNNGNWTRGYVYLGGQMIAVQAAVVSWVHQDPVTKSQRVTDNLGNVISVVDLDPWGGETSRSSNQAFQPHRYTTYERDANGGDDAMHRRYQTYWNRFSQPDPHDGSYSLTDPQSFNRYAYVQNDPVNLVDPSGLEEDEGDCTDEFNETGVCTVVDGGTYEVDVFDDGGSDLIDDPFSDPFLIEPFLLSPQNPQPNPNCIANAVSGGRVGNTRNIIPSVSGGNAHDGIHVEAGPGLHSVTALPAMAGGVLHAGRQSRYPDDAGYGFSVVDILLNIRIDGQRYVMTLKDMGYNTGIRSGRVTPGRTIGSVEGSANPVGETGLHVTLMPRSVYNQYINGRFTSGARSSVPANQLMDAARDPRSPFRCP